jgi:hypothetical protein
MPMYFLSDVKPEDHWQAIDFPLVRLLSSKNVLRFVLNRAAAEYAGASAGTSCALT